MSDVSWAGSMVQKGCLCFVQRAFWSRLALPKQPRRGLRARRSATSSAPDHRTAGASGSPAGADYLPGTFPH